MGFKRWLMRTNRSDRTFREEMWKQLVDQNAHMWWGLATGFVPWGAETLFSTYVSPGAGALALGIGTVLSLASICGWIYREWEQARDGSHTVWDPYLDSFVYIVGVVGGVLGSVFFALALTN